MTRKVLTIALLAMLGLVLLMVHRCHSSEQPPAVDASAATSDQSPSMRVAEDADGAAARQAARMARHDESMRTAVSTLHQYLAALGSGAGERAKADAFWVDGRVPARSGEANLRQLPALRSLRSENGQPVAMDGDDMPSTLQIPIEVRVSTGTGPLLRYRGWYRMRRAVADDRWQISSASVDALPATQ